MGHNTKRKAQYAESSPGGLRNKVTVPLLTTRVSCICSHQ